MIFVDFQKSSSLFHILRFAPLLRLQLLFPVEDVTTDMRSLEGHRKCLLHEPVRFENIAPTKEPLTPHTKTALRQGVLIGQTIQTLHYEVVQVASSLRKLRLAILEGKG